MKDNIDFIQKFDQSLLELLKGDEDLEFELEVIDSKIGQPTLQIIKDGRPLFLHSKYDPIQEAERIIENLSDIDQYDHIFFYGLGLGYHVDVLLKKCPTKKISIVEPSKEVFKKYLEYKLIKNLPFERLAFLKVGLSENETKLFIQEFFNFIQEKTLLVTLPSYERLIPAQFDRFIQDFKKIIEDKRSSLLTDYSFQKRWTLNSWCNLPDTLSTPNILHDVDKGYFQNKPAIIVAAGPSLNDEIENLKYIKEQGWAYIFSVGAAINTLIENNIYPDAMCTYDPKRENQTVFKKVISKEINSIPLIYGTSVGFETLENYKGPKFHMVTSQDTIADFYLKRRDNASISKVNDAPSIAVVTLQLLDKLGCNPIILVGQNLAYRGKEFYARGMNFNSELPDAELIEAVKVTSVDGDEVLTNESFNSMRTQIEYYLENLLKGKIVINTTKNGAHIEGTVYRELSDLIRGELKASKISRQWSNSVNNDYDHDHVKDKQKDMQEKLDELYDLLRNIKRIFNKMDQLIVERKLVKLEKMFNKFDVEMRRFVQNDFYLTFLQPMSRVEFDLLTKEINSLKFDSDIVSKAKKTIKSFKRLVNSCEFDLKNLSSIFVEVNKKIAEYINNEIK